MIWKYFVDIAWWVVANYKWRLVVVHENVRIVTCWVNRVSSKAIKFFLMKEQKQHQSMGNETSRKLLLWKNDGFSWFDFVELFDGWGSKTWCFLIFKFVRQIFFKMNLFNETWWPISDNISLMCIKLQKISRVNTINLNKIIKHWDEV